MAYVKFRYCGHPFEVTVSQGFANCAHCGAATEWGASDVVGTLEPTTAIAGQESDMPDDGAEVAVETLDPLARVQMLAVGVGAIVIGALLLVWTDGIVRFLFDFSPSPSAAGVERAMADAVAHSGLPMMRFAIRLFGGSLAIFGFLKILNTVTAESAPSVEVAGDGANASGPVPAARPVDVN